MKFATTRIIFLCCLAALLISTRYSFGQATTFTAGANWSTGTWSNGLANSTSFNPTIASNVNVNVTYTGIGNLTLNASTTLTIPVGQTLTIGASGLPKNFAAGVSATINVRGTLIIWGNFTSGGSIQFKVFNGGSVTVKGNATFAAGDNTDITAGGTFTVNGITTGAGQLQGGGTFYASGGCTPPASGFCTSGSLPIQLISFDGKVNLSSIGLSWSTASELNFEYFDIEHSTDGKKFNSLAHVMGHGTSQNRIDYTFEDISPMIGNNYYRLTSVDFDDYKEIFKVILLQFIGERDFHVNPNPSDGLSINIEFNFNESQGQMYFYNSIGSEISNFSINKASEIRFPQQLKPGIYFAKYTSSSYTKTIRFLVK